MSKIDLSGQRFERLTVIRDSGKRSGGSILWECQCDCGNTTLVRSDKLRNGTTKSCGCFRKDKNLILHRPGERFGRLTIISQSTESPNKWICKCDCGNTISVLGKDLRRGHVQSCGCLQKETSSNNGRKSLVDLTGKRFGRLLVIEEATIDQRPEKDHAAWICQCDCGNQKIVSGYKLRNGNTQSCGCYRRECKRVDITGKRFGKLIALERDEEYSSEKNGTFWKCKCDCGNSTTVYLGHLQSGHTQSCGCDKTSIGERNIEKILNDNSINYIHNREYFKDLILPSGGIGRFDFILIDNKSSPYRIIEFDGIQHFQDVSKNWGSLTSRKEIDNKKTQYALSHNIPLVRIPYWERDNITIDLILGDKYLIKETADAPDMEEAQDT